MLDYQGRTELLKDDITNGSVSLRIRDIQPSDEGQYTFLFQSLTFFQGTSVLLQVEGLGSGPDISVEGHQDGGIKVVCRSSRWYPQPEAQWRDLQGQFLPSASENISRAAGGLFQTEIAIVITEESNQKVSCCVRNPRVNQERESAIYIAGILLTEMERENERLQSELAKQKDLEIKIQIKASKRIIIWRYTSLIKLEGC
ncbi:butyrophilin-like protein 2 isoform X4 [Mauremys mutica]|uniref:butyrophilin-like protein 2 isoform X4 n=1 Tax=Mauremys mutica TaxID=74926 RepID=UPI001D147CA4|nr:butyrophilin-like protein 2 isoform X4 [Mauremys mutica]